MCSRGQLVPKNPASALRKYDRSALQKLGSGDFGTVFRVTDSATGAIRAWKTVTKAEGGELGKDEAEIMWSLDHPSLVRLFEVIEDKTAYYLVLELCEGGDLLTYITQAKESRYTEPIAATVLRPVFTAVNFMQERHIAHNDLNAKNVLLEKKGSLENNFAKVADFGSACSFDPCAGSMRSDLFSLGLLMRGLVCNTSSLTKCLPGGASKNVSSKAKAKASSKQLKEAKKEAMVASEWTHASQEARCLCGRLLRRDASSRWSALEGLRHPWWPKALADKIPPVKIPPDMLAKLKRYAECSRLQKVVLQAIADQLGDKEDASTQSLRSLFWSLDLDGDGLLTPRDLLAAYEQAGEAAKKAGGKAAAMAVPSEREVKEALESMDPDGLGALEMGVFAGAMLCPPKANKHLPPVKVVPVSKMTDTLLTEEMVRGAFRIFDRDADGRVSCKDAHHVLSGSNLKQVKRFFQAHKPGGDGYLDFDDIVAMLQVHTECDESQDAGNSSFGFSVTKTFLAKSAALENKTLRTVDDDLDDASSCAGSSIEETSEVSDAGDEEQPSMAESEDSFSSSASPSSAQKQQPAVKAKPKAKKKKKMVPRQASDSGSTATSAADDGLISSLKKPSSTRGKGVRLQVRFREETLDVQQTPDAPKKPQPRQATSPQTPPGTAAGTDCSSPRRRVTSFSKPSAAEKAELQKMMQTEDSDDDCQPPDEKMAAVDSGQKLPPGTSVNLQKARKNYQFDPIYSTVHVENGASDNSGPCATYCV
eukprot:gb/GFBE01041083.1/.p1 GENE.gb/GFBE01041083.1/~~gb/GFBE01041083.1/.p1  ORF type:complete len:762 (+),score=195.53 gb/GFBE01041083.1/:1-2286(+)